ncbi:MAG: hypothetical protein KIY10_08955 [Thermoplasmata archaeon]|jgi:hypothetical protein|nr:hypothetical protein [Candidatus Sysuiplasma jiujiangense]MBX8640434.1 hypothetical protein [Candidatus Sysuiplasma jiujiangense]MBX8642690.1 hypothetical protein [Candidatus Sysuiplasma jiujiangense]
MMHSIEKILARLRDSRMRDLSISILHETGIDAERLNILSTDAMRRIEPEALDAAIQLARAKLEHIRIEAKLSDSVNRLSSITSRLESAEVNFKKELNNYGTYLQDNRFLISLVDGGDGNSVRQSKIR